jgi:hypothetical protein
VKTFLVQTVSTAGTEHVERVHREVTGDIRNECAVSSGRARGEEKRRDLPDPASSNDHSTLWTIVVRWCFDTFTATSASGMEDDRVLRKETSSFSSRFSLDRRRESFAPE